MAQLTGERIFRFAERFFNLKKFLHLPSVDFNAGWRGLIWQQKHLLFITLFFDALTQIFISLFPIALGLVISRESYTLMIMLFGVWITLVLCENITWAASNKLQLQSIYGLYASAHAALLKTDPLALGTRSSGAIIAKIDRGSKAIEDVLDLICFEITPIIIRTITIIITLASFDAWIATAMLTALLFYLLLTTFLNLKVAEIFQPRIIKALDKSRSTGAENLSQHGLIRSCFASDEMYARLERHATNAMAMQGTGWYTYSTQRISISLIYVLIFAGLAFYLLKLCKEGLMETALAISLLLSFISSTVDLVKISKHFYKLLKNVSYLDDLFLFIRLYSKQSFPVLAQDMHGPVQQWTNDAVLLRMQDVSFGYPGQPLLFQHLSCSVTIGLEAPNKLFGIIGPSGVGKTSFISLIGGQLKPNKGLITVNGVDIYAVSDSVRRQLIGIQQQTASSMRGSLRFNVTFGLPETYHLSDEELIKVLKDVGLWPLFEYKEGLATFIGEGGLTLSGGQRQRLNFANLYLRANCYRPLLLLIDEPTSSLDTVSEQAITRMIHELSQRAVVFVIAHRLETLQHAAGLIDFSLVSDTNKIELNTFEQLLQKSPYFARLSSQQEELEV